MNKVKTIELKVVELIPLTETIFQMSKTKGHFMGYEINKNLSVLKKVVSDWDERVKALKERFNSEENKVVLNKNTGVIVEEYKEGRSLSEDEIIGSKLSKEEAKEYNSEMKLLNEETAEINFLMFDDEKLQKAFENGIFEGFDASPYFDFIDKVGE